jgi:hypothetical protein
MDKLGVIVPYKNREEHLSIFKKHITEYLSKEEIQFELIIVEQSDNKPFNRGKLLNIGFLEAKRLGCNYVVFHDVDMLPIEVDYSYSNKVLHLATNFISDTNYNKETFDSYFGGVTMFPTNIFEKINGYSNEYWGWGFEDDDLLKRCMDNDIETNSNILRNKQTNITGLNFSGKNSYIKVKNNINYALPIKINATFNVNLVLDESKDYDEYTIFSIPGYDMTLTYNSFGRYKFEFWDYQKNVYSITSKITKTYLTNIVIEINPMDCIIKMVQDNEYVSETTYNRKLLAYSKEPYLYIGNAHPYRGVNFKELYGYVSDFKIWNDDNLLIDLDFKNYISHNVYNKPMEEICDLFGCSKIQINENKYTLFPEPLRRKSIFKLLEHENNGFEEGKWKNIETRLNQIKFYSNKNIESGLSDLEFVTHSRVVNDNVTKINVEI